jgi:hypothetical protein
LSICLVSDIYKRDINLFCYPDLYDSVCLKRDI